MDESGFDPTIGALNAALNIRLMNQNVISANIANADTPGYQAKAIDFEAALREATRTEGTGHSHASREAIQPEIYDEPGSASLDGNTVDRSKEMAKMAENQLL